MDIKYYCAWWGLDHLGMEGMLRKIKEAGYDGAEVFAPLEARERDLLKRLLEGQEQTLQTAINRTEHIHARVGFAEGPQISDPRSPEWVTEMSAFTSWWQRIVD